MASVRSLGKGRKVTRRSADVGLDSRQRFSANIGWQDKDAYGKSLSRRQREKMQRLRTWNERFRTRNSKERSLKHALGEIDRMASALGLPESVRETGGVVYRRALDENLLPGRSIEGMATASVYAALRLDGLPRTIEQVANVSRIPEIEFTRAYRYLARELGLKIPPTNPMNFVGKLCLDIGCDDETAQRSREALQMAIEVNVHSGKHPAGLAASAIYVAGQLKGEKITQSTLSEAANVGEITIRNRYREVFEVLEAEP